MKKMFCVTSILCIILMASTVFAGQQQVCKSWTPAMVGGPVAQGKDLLSVRWMAEGNVELTYNKQVILLSAYYDRGPDFPRYVNVDDVNRVDAIFLGHAHGDHMTEAAKFALQSGAPVYGHYTATDAAREQGVPDSQLVTVKDGDVFQFKGFTVEAIHIRHSGTGPVAQTPPEIAAMWNDLRAALRDPKSAEQLAWEANPNRGYGSRDPIVRDVGVFAYLFTFGKDFSFVYHDSSNATLTPQIEAAIARIGGRVDIASVAYAGGPEKYAIPYNMPEIKLYNPKYYFSNHHYTSYVMDQIPLFLAIRDELPGTTPIFLLPKQPACFSVYSHKIISDGIIE